MAKQVALITGASSGIGTEFARVFAREGYDLILTGRNKSRLDEIAGSLKPAIVRTIAADLGHSDGVESLLEELGEEARAVTALVNNAGMILHGEVSQLPWNEQQQMIQLNFSSLVHLTHRILPHMLQRHQGAILNVGSTGSFIAGPYNTTYCATKAAVLSFSEALAEEISGSGVTVTCLCPGATRTELQKRANMENVKLMDRGVMDAGPVAELGYRAMKAGKRVIVPGLSNQISALSTRFLPRATLVRMAKSLLSKH